MHQAIYLLKKIPKGKVATYKELARVCRTSPRAIGRIMASNEHPKEYPCYKVVASDGKLCGYRGQGGIRAKKRLLQKDGVVFEEEKVSPICFYQFSS